MDVYQTTSETEHSHEGESVGELQKRRETMADGRRYIIYYTFGQSEEKQSEPREGEKDV